MDKHDPRRAPSEAELQDVHDNWVDEYAPEDKHEADYFYGRTNHVATNPKKKSKKWPWLGVVIFILVAAGGAYVLMHPKQTTAPSVSPKSGTQQKQKPKATETKTKPYISTNLGISLNVPTDWKIMETTDALTLISPELSLVTTPDSLKTGHVQLKIQNKQTAIPALKDDLGTAILDSEKLTYTKPSQNQRAQTYLTFIAYGVTDGGLDAAYVTGDNGYVLGQTVPESDLVLADPLIGVSFVTCPQTDCATTGQTLNLNPAKFAASTAHDQLVKILTSLQLV